VTARPGDLPGVLTALDPDALAAGLERNFADLQSHYALGAGGVVRDHPDIRLSGSGLPARVVNAVNLARLTSATATDRIAEAKSFFGDLGVPFRWFVGPTSSPTDLPERLETAGLPPLTNSPGMALDIAAMRDEPPPIAGLKIDEVAGAAALDEWLEVCRVSFPFDDATADVWRRVHIPAGFGEDRPLRNFVARLDGRPVACSALFTNGHVAGIWNVGTVAEVRGRGIGRAVTLAALRTARTLGYRVAILGSSPLGFPVYSRIGFVEVCRIRHFGPPLPVPTPLPAPAALPDRSH